MALAGPADPIALRRAIVLAGGRARRLGGRDKAALRLRGETLLARTLRAVAGTPVVVVGPATVTVPRGVLRVSEDPPGGGPAAGVVAGLRADTTPPGDADAGGGQPLEGRPLDTKPLEAQAGAVAVLAVDQPGVDAGTVTRLLRALSAHDSGAVVVADGRRQYTIGVFTAVALHDRAASRPSWHGAALRDLLDPLVSTEVPARPAEARDVDEPADWQYWLERER